jgi:hypothetical protein
MSLTWRFVSRKILMLGLLFLAGCASSFEKYPDACVLTQPDKGGSGVTTGTFPCKLQHHEKP